MADGQATLNEDENPLNRVTDPAFEMNSTAVPLRLFFRAIDPIVDEARVTVGARETAEWDNTDTVDGIHVTAVDPHNVAMVDVSLPAKGGGFGTFDTGEPHTLGVNVGTMLTTLGFARMSGKGVDDDGDPVAFRYDADLMRLDTTMTRSSHQTQRVRLLNTLPPDSIREEPDLPALNLPNKGLPDGPRAFKDAVKGLEATSDTVRVRADPNVDHAFQIHSEGEGAVDGDSVRFLNSYEGNDEQESSSFSTSYLKAIAKGLKTAHVDKIVVRWGDDLPAVFEFYEETYGIRGQYMVSPRVHAED
jgi:hypothetical protein